MLFKDMINPVKWVHYARYLLRKLTGKVKEEAGFRTPEDMAWQSEVIVFRGLMCPECKANGKCVGIAEGETEPCGCDFIGKSTDMSLECSLGLWPATPTKEAWERQREIFLHGLKIGLIKNEIK
jgi:hypothetical protein